MVSSISSSVYDLHSSEPELIALRKLLLYFASTFIQENKEGKNTIANHEGNQYSNISFQMCL